MQLRIPYFDLSTDALSGLGSVNAYLETCSVEKELIELIYLRVSEINGCSFCLKKHSKALCEMGVSQEKLDVLSGWKSRSIFSEKEMAALGWAESLTHISVTHAPDEDCQQLTNYFSEKEISDLTFCHIKHERTKSFGNSYAPIGCAAKMGRLRAAATLSRCCTSPY